MSLTEIFKHAWNKAQQKEFCHKKLMKLVENAFDKSKLEELLVIFTEALLGCYYSNCADKNPYCARGLEFLAKIVMKITLECVQPIGITNPNGSTSQVYDITLDPFFTNVLKSSLKFSDVDKAEVRFNTCYFITSLLQNIGNNVEMDYSICNIILDSLVPLLHDPKANVRIQAIKALVRLQEPSNAECIVLKSFLILSTDPNSEVRKSVISHIAPHPQSYVKVRLRTTDTDISVRQAAYMKFADVNPKMCLKIIDRNIILNNGLNDQNKKIKHIMSDILLPKWLNSFEGDYLLFFRALRLDADENDINNFEKLCTDILDIFLRKNSLTDIVKYLPVDKEDKLIPNQQLRLESVFYWSNLINYLRNVEDGEEYLVNILPELTAFSNYIERIIKERSSVTMDEWENLEYQTILLQLFNISSGFDMSDEVGRKTLYTLILKLLTTNKFYQKVIDKMLQVAAQLNSDVGSFTIDVCQIISEIREPLINEMPSEDKLRKRNFEVTQLKVKIHQLEINEEEALKKKDFQLAHMVQNEMKECQRVLDDLKNMYSVSEKVRVSKDDPETLCRCLDILIGLLKIPNITIMCPALRSCRDEFLMPLLSNNSSEILWRFLLSLGLFSLMDKDLAFKHINFLCLPIATYRVVPNCDKLALKTSIACVTDVIRVFGVKVIGMEENSQSELNQEGNPATSRRKLYSEDLSQPEVFNKDDITIEFIIDIIVDMLDDEDEGVRQTASTSIQRLIIHNFPVSPELICRLILKWYNPETEKQDSRLNIQLGTIIECFATKTKGARRVVQKAILPIISSIVNASGTSPLLEIDIENVLRFLAALTNDDTETIHDEIALNLIEKMLNKPNDACAPYLIKLLTYLEPTFKDFGICKNIIDSTELLLGDIVEKIPKKYLLKFREKLTSGLKNASVVTQGDQSEINVTNGTEGNIGNHSSLIRKSLINGDLTHENHELGDIDGSEKESESNQKGNSSSSESDSEEDSVESNSNSNAEGSDKVKGFGKRLLHNNDEKNTFKGKAKLQKISEELESVDQSNKSIDCEETAENSEADIESFSNENSAPVKEREEGRNDTIVCVKYDYTPEKNAEKSNKLNKTTNKSENIKSQTSGRCRVERQETTKSNIEVDKLSVRSSRSTRSNTNSKNENVKIISQVFIPKRNKKNLEINIPSGSSSRTNRSNVNPKNDNVQIISKVEHVESSEKNLETGKSSVGSLRSTRSNTNSKNENVQIISQVVFQKTNKKNSETNEPSKISTRTNRSNVNTKNDNIQIISKVEPAETSKKKLETDELSLRSSRSTRSNTNTNSDHVQTMSQNLIHKTKKKDLDSNDISVGCSQMKGPKKNSKNDNIQVKPQETSKTKLVVKLSKIPLKSNRSIINSNNDDISHVELQKTPKKELNSNKPSVGSSRTTRSNPKSGKDKIQIIPQVPVTSKRNSDINKLVSPRSTRSNIIKAKNRIDYISIVSPKTKLKIKHGLSNNKITSTETEDEEKSTPNKKSPRKTSTPSKFKDYVTSSVQNPLKAFHKQKKVEKRSAETPLSTIANRKSKRRSNNSSAKKPEASNKANNSVGTHSLQTPLRKSRTPLFSVGMRSSRRFSKSVATLSIKKKTSKSQPFLVVELNRSLRNTPKISRKDPNRQLQSNSLKKKANKKQNTKEQEEVKSSIKEKEGEPNSSNNSDGVFKKPRRKNSKEVPKDKMNNNKNSKSDSKQKIDEVLQSLNSVMNEINSTSVNRRSSRISDNSLNENLSTRKHSSKTKSKKRLQQESVHSSTLTRSRMSDQLNVSNSSSRKKLDFSSFSEETILKTLLQGDEEFQVLENMSIEDVTSLSNTSHDSKKENVSVNVSTTSSSSKSSTRRKRNHSGSPEAPPKKKMMAAKYKKRVS